MNNWYFNIYGWMIEDLHLRGAELLVFAYLYSWTDKDHYETQEQIAKKLGITRQAYISAISRIVKKLYTKNVKKLDKTMSRNFTLIVKKLDKTMSRNFTRTIHKQNTYTSTKTEDNAHTRTREEEQKKEQPKTDEETLRYPILKAMQDFYEQELRQPYIPNFQYETTAIGELAAKINYIMQKNNWATDAESVMHWFFNFLKAAHRTADEWQRKHFDIRTINSQFQTFVNQIYNGNKSSQNGGRSSDAAFAATIRSYLASE